MTDQEDVVADVVRLHPDRDLTDDDAPLHQQPKGTCRHDRIRLVQDAHRGYCRECDSEVDLFDYLWRLAGNWEWVVRTRKEAQRRANEAQARLEETLRLERNARGRVRRRDPSAKLPKIPWGEGSASL